jgi:hypothetical protein
MQHFFCEGDCKGVSATPKTCDEPTCPNFGKPLTDCDCEDEVHHKTDNDENEEENGD